MYSEKLSLRNNREQNPCIADRYSICAAYAKKYFEALIIFVKWCFPYLESNSYFWIMQSFLISVSYKWLTETDKNMKIYAVLTICVEFEKVNK